MKNMSGQPRGIAQIALLAIVLGVVVLGVGGWYMSTRTPTDSMTNTTTTNNTSTFVNTNADSRAETNENTNSTVTELAEAGETTKLDPAEIATKRDAQRLIDVRNFQSSLELMWEDTRKENGTASYPKSPATGEAITRRLFERGYLAVVPSAPVPADGACSSEENRYTYRAYTNSQDLASCTPDDTNVCTYYAITFCLGAGSGKMDAGIVIADNSGLYSKKEWDKRHTKIEAPVVSNTNTSVPENTPKNNNMNSTAQDDFETLCPTEKRPVIGWKSYVNEMFHYSVSYPEGYEVRETGTGGVQFGDIIPNLSITHADMPMYHPTDDVSINDWVKTYYLHNLKDYAGPAVIDGLEAAHIYATEGIPTGTPGEEYLIKKGGQMFRLGAYHFPKSKLCYDFIIEEFFKSFHFTEQ